MSGRFGKIGTVWKRPWFLVSVVSLLCLGMVVYSVNDIMITLLHSNPEVSVPDLEGKSLMEALSIVSARKLSLQQDGTEFDETLPAGTILRQHPPSGMKIRTGRSLRVVVSKGGQVVFVPLVMGKALAEAQSILALDNLQIGALRKIYSTETPEGAVISQTPSSGTVVTRGALIDFEISKGMPPAGAPLLPDFIGVPLKAVQRWAHDVGAQVVIREEPSAVGSAGHVIDQSPIAGQPLLEGEKINVTIVPLLAEGEGYRVIYQVPREEGISVVRIVARDNRGESEIYRGEHKGGDDVEVPVAVNSTTRVRIYVNDVLKSERVLEP